MAQESLKDLVERLQRENQALKDAASRKRTLKVSEKGGVSLYGMRRFPITFYKEEWNSILDMADDIRAFLAANKDSLTSKG